MRIYLLGLNQPQVGSPALWPHPPGCAGHRLWQMVNEVSDISMDDWIAQTQRVNLLSDPVLPRDYRGAARKRGEWLAPMIANRTVILLGADVAYGMDFKLMPFEWDTHRRWAMIPHPSGRNLFYNSPVARRTAGELIANAMKVISEANATE